MFNWLYTAISWVLLQWHHLFNFFGLDPAGGLNWALSIVFLVITARLLLFRLFVKQVKYQREMQKLQPELQRIRKKYKDDRAEMQRQMMAFQQEHGFNPLAGCLPMFAQLPVFYALYHTLRHLANSVYSCDNSFKTDSHLSLYGFTPTETCNAAKSRLFGAPLAGRLTDSQSQIHLLGGTQSTTVTVIIILVLISAGATYMTQRLVRAGNPVAAEGTAATVQKLMLYVIPLGTLGSGLFFPLGVLLYWFTSNTWTMCQQLYINKFHPHEDKLKPKSGELGKTLAPPPGKRPVRPGKPGSAAPSAPSAQSTPSTPSLVKEAPPEDTSGAASRTGTPRPGQKPQRPGGTRPPGKRPSKAKKRR